MSLTVKSLIEKLSKYPDYYLVVLSKDLHGEKFTLADDDITVGETITDENEFGVDFADRDEDAGDEGDLVPNSICIWPAS
jgi:hypothetical protein